MSQDRYGQVHAEAAAYQQRMTAEMGGRTVTLLALAKDMTISEAKSARQIVDKRIRELELAQRIQDARSAVDYLGPIVDIHTDGCRHTHVHEWQTFEDGSAGCVDCGLHLTGRATKTNEL